MGSVLNEMRPVQVDFGGQRRFRRESLVPDVKGGLAGAHHELRRLRCARPFGRKRHCLPGDAGTCKVVNLHSRAAPIHHVQPRSVVAHLQIAWNPQLARLVPILDDLTEFRAIWIKDPNRAHEGVGEVYLSRSISGQPQGARHPAFQNRVDGLQPTTELLQKHAGRGEHLETRLVVVRNDDAIKLFIYGDRAWVYELAGPAPPRPEDQRKTAVAFKPVDPVPVCVDHIDPPGVRSDVNVCGADERYQRFVITQVSQQGKGAVVDLDLGFIAQGNEDAPVGVDGHAYRPLRNGPGVRQGARSVEPDYAPGKWIGYQDGVVRRNREPGGATEPFRQ